MQSDKTAATRAIGQNRQLKVQLEELEKAFIQLVSTINVEFYCQILIATHLIQQSNDKLVLTEQSQTALRVNKELNDRIAVMEPELLRLR